MILHLILGALLLLIPMGALYYFDKSLLRSFGVAVGRMVVQVLVLCLMVWALVHFDHVWLNLLWLVLLSVVSAAFVFRRVKLPLSRGVCCLWPPACSAGHCPWGCTCFM